MALVGVALAIGATFGTLPFPIASALCASAGLLAMRTTRGTGTGASVAAQAS